MDGAIKRDWQGMFDAQVARVREGGERPPLLLHACCAPCTSGVLERLADVFRVIVFYYNPNIAPRKEYERRLEELRRFIAEYPLCAAYGVALEVEDAKYDEWETAVGLRKDIALITEAERGERCKRCCAMRLERTAQKSSELGAQYFATTLTLSPHKDADMINKIGLAANGANGAKYLVSDFKKRDGFLKSLRMSAEYDLYRQQYCGCKCSMRMDSSK